MGKELVGVDCIFESSFIDLIVSKISAGLVIFFFIIYRPINHLSFYLSSCFISKENFIKLATHTQY